MNWISVNERVPNDRRVVLTWGTSFGVGFSRPPHFLAATRFNPGRNGGKFDIEVPGFWGLAFAHVTHWAEIPAPPESLPSPPPEVP